jgi:hypothetical protein
VFFKKIKALLDKSKNHKNVAIVVWLLTYMLLIAVIDAALKKAEVSETIRNIVASCTIMTFSFGVLIINVVEICRAFSKQSRQKNCVARSEKRKSDDFYSENGVLWFPHRGLVFTTIWIAIVFVISLVKVISFLR